MWMRRRTSSTTEISPLGSADWGARPAGHPYPVLRHGRAQNAAYSSSFNREWVRNLNLTSLAIACVMALSGVIFYVAWVRSGLFDRWPSADSGTSNVVRSMQLIITALIVFNAVVLVLTASEIHNRRLAHVALKEAKRGAKLTETLFRLGRWYWDAAADRLQLTERTRELLAIGPNEPISLDKFVSTFHRDDRMMLVGVLRRAIKSAQPFSADVRVVNREGRVYWLNLRGKVASDDRKAPTRLIGVVSDVTERKRVEADVEGMRKQLRQLSQASNLGNFSGALVHELNQPLAAIMSNAQAAERMLQQHPINITELSNTLRDIIEDDSRAGAVITHLRALFKNDESSWTSLAINDVVQEAIRNLQPNLTRQNIEVAVRTARDLPQIFGNRVQLGQVILNFLTNAAEAMEDNGEQQAKRIRVATYLDREGHVTVAVSDTGSGLPPQHDAQMFTPFFTTKTRGLGLGLSICRSVVTSHGGWLWAVNNSDRGSTFYVAMPALREAAP